MGNGGWAQIGHELGLAATMVSERSMLGWSFASFRRELAEPLTPDPKSAMWLHGPWKGVAALVRTGAVEVAPAPVPIYEKSFAQLSPPRRFAGVTMAIAEIDPPLFAGARMVSMPSYRFGEYAAELAVTLEPVVLHRAFWTRASNPRRLQRFFEREGPSDDFVEVLAAAARRVNVAIQDAVVEVFLPGNNHEARVISGALDVAVAVAKELSRRSAAMPEDPSVVRSKEAWAAVAASRGLQFDPLRWHAFGRVNGIPLEVHLEPTETYVRTTVRALFRAPLGAALSIAPNAMSSFFGLVTQSSPVSTGDAVFDQLFWVEAHDPVRARSILGSPLRQHLMRSGGATTHVLVNDAEVLLAVERCAEPQELAALIDDAVAVVEVATPKASTPPYR